MSYNLAFLVKETNLPQKGNMIVDFFDYLFPSVSQYFQLASMS
ncbi:MAG: hypothetical protein ACTHJ8_10495 [Mucilaginibacter sp.]